MFHRAAAAYHGVRMHRMRPSLITPLLLLALATSSCSMDRTKVPLDPLVVGGWVDGAVWDLTFHQPQSATFEHTILVTSAPARTCFPGRWHRLEILGSKGVFLRTAPVSPAYTSFRGVVHATLQADACDATRIFTGIPQAGEFFGSFPSTSADTMATVLGKRSR
jgi:hypothetical protein